MENNGYFTQFLYLLVYSSSLICAAAVAVFRKRLSTDPDRPLRALIILTAVCSSLISVQVFLSAVGLLQQLNEASSARLTLTMNMLIILAISATVYAAVSVSYGFRSGTIGRTVSRITAGATTGILIVIIFLQVLTLFVHSLRAAELLGILMTAGIALYSVLVIFAAVRLFIPFSLKTDEYGHSTVRILLLLLFAFPALFLISGSLIGAIAAPAGFIALNILGTRIIFLRIIAQKDIEASTTGGVPRPDPAELCRELGLSKRESEVAVLLARGCAYKDIAAELFISMSTTQTHVGRIYSKLGINNKTELSNLIIR